MIQINAAARLPPKVLGWTLRGWVAALVSVVDHRDPNPAADGCSVI
jgi:hypothetical protein